MESEQIQEILDLINNRNFVLSQHKVLELIKMNPSNKKFKNILAIIYASQDKFEDAIKVLESILLEDPNYYDSILNLANIYKNINQFDESKHYFEKAIMVRQSDVFLQLQYAELIDKTKDYVSAEKIYKKISDLDPNNLEILINFSTNQIFLKKFENAKNILNKILFINNMHLSALVNLGVVEYKLGNHIDAKKYFEKVLSVDENFSEAIFNLGVLQFKNEKFEKAKEFFNKTIKINPRHFEALTNLAYIAQKENNIEQAISLNHLAIDLNPIEDTPYFNLALINEDLNNIDKSMHYYKKAIELNPSKHDAKYNLARLHLYLHQYEEGWKNYESRDEKVIRFDQELKIAESQVWDFKSFDGELIIHGEQGLGDMMMFSTMLNEVLQIHGKVTVITMSRLAKLFRKIFTNITFLDQEGELFFPPNSKHILFGSLGKYFRKSIDDFLNADDYFLEIDKDRVDEFNKIIDKNNKIKVGISWKSTGVYNDKRNLNIEEFVSIFDPKKFDLINLQYGDISEERKILNKIGREIIIFDKVDYKNDFISLGAIMSSCDLIVAVCGFNVSLAGALGKNVWCLVPGVHEWVWNHIPGGDRSPWFPSVKIITQEKVYDWQSVFNKLREDITKFHKEKN